MHAEGAPEQGICFAVAADVVKLAGDRAMIILGKIQRQPIIVLPNPLVL
jgi:hypothetical protein